MSELELNKELILRVAREELVPLMAALAGPAAAGGRVGWLGGDWTGCGDFRSAVQFAVTGRADLPRVAAGGGRRAGSTGDRLAPLLAAAGWTRRHDHGTDPRRRGLRRNGLRLELVEYPVDRFVLISLIGPCLSAPRARLDELLATPRCWLIRPA
jgi:hypothetical protein